MKGRDIKGLGGPPSTDLLVCFPSRGHLSLMPKPICSPVKHSEPNKRHHHHQHHNLLKKINTKGGGGPASPLLWAKNKQMRGGGSNGPEIAEPTSPKVTCAGQIKVRPRPSAACKNWESVMEEIERIHNRSKHKKKSNWAGPLGFKKDVMNFLTCLRSIRLDFRCFGSFPEPDVITSDDEEDDEEEEEYVVDDHEDYKEAGDKGTDKGSTVFSKWFMVLQENQQGNINGGELENDNNAPAVPPPNALLLMRCRSAPAKSWLEERENRAKKETEEQRKEETEKDKERENDEKKEEEAKVGQRKKKRESLAIVMKYDADFYNLSTDVAQETWLVGGLKDPFSRSRSWKR